MHRCSIGFSEERFEDIALELELACLESEHKDLVEINVLDKDRKVYLFMDNVNETNFERALGIFLDSAYAILEKLD